MRRCLYLLLILLVGSFKSLTDDIPPNGYIFALTTDGQMVIVQADEPMSEPMQLDIGNEITGIVWSDATQSFATSNLNGQVTVYPVDDEPVVIVERGFLSLGDWSSDGRFLLVIIAQDNIPVIVAYDIQHDSFVTLEPLFDMAFAPYTVRWSADGETIYFDPAGITINTLSTHCLTNTDSMCETQTLYFFDDLTGDEPEYIGLPMPSTPGDELAFVCGNQLMLCTADLATGQITLRIETGQIAVGHGAGLAPQWIGQSLYYFQQGTLHQYDLLTGQQTTVLPVLPLDTTPNYWYWGYIETSDITAAVAHIVKKQTE